MIFVETFFCGETHLVSLMSHDNNNDVIVNKIGRVEDGKMMTTYT